MIHKWHRFLVSGKQVTPEQASVIAIQTQDYRRLRKEASGNSELALSLLRLTKNEDWVRDREEEKEKLGSLNLRHFSNNTIIDPNRSWISWDGTICEKGDRHLAHYPKVEEVLADLSMIASSYPFLQATFQILQSEGLTERWYHMPIVEFRISEGVVVQTQTPLKLLFPSYSIARSQRRPGDPQPPFPFFGFMTALSHIPGHPKE